MENNEFKKFALKMMCYYFNDIIKVEDLDLDDDLDFDL